MDEIISNAPATPKGTKSMEDILSDDKTPVNIIKGKQMNEILSEDKAPADTNNKILNEFNPKDITDNTNNLNPNSLGYSSNSELMDTPNASNIEEKSPSGAEITKKSKESKLKVTSPVENKKENSKEKSKKEDKTDLHSELADIINENNHIGREIFKMSEENKKLVQLLRSFSASSNISKEKKRNLEAYIASQTSLLNDAKKLFVKEYNKMRSMENEINTLKANNSYMKKKLKECRENEFKMKLQSSNDKYLLHSIASKNEIARRNYSSATSIPSLQRYRSIGSIYDSSSNNTSKISNNSNNTNNNKTIKINKSSSSVSQKWKQHEDTCNQQ